jgi:DNA-binding transcriptional MerR regulator
LPALCRLVPLHRYSKVIQTEETAMIRATASALDQPAGEKPMRTIGEAAAELGVEPHVLRFWESKFSQIQPLKRTGGRRYYRPSDVALLRRIRGLLYNDGYTIKGVQRLLDDETGASHGIAAMTGPHSVNLAAARPLPPAVADIDDQADIASTLKDLQDALALLRQTLRLS